jgi:glycosyltransferase involved in cell wall biosynthesis
MIKLSLIITTYNRPDALTAVLAALTYQSDLFFEVVIADDGSTSQTRDLVHSFIQNSPFPILHVWQPDEGFRAARSRNQAILAATGDYIVFIDGDCLPRPNFIARHRDLAEAHYFVSGNRILLSSDYTETLLADPSALATWKVWDYLKLYLHGKINRWMPVLFLPLGVFRILQPMRWRGAKTCNLGVWKKDLVAVNGFDESYNGWGYEDSDLVLRLIHLGVKNKSGRFAVSVLHLWHSESNRDQESINLKRLEQVKDSQVILATKGLQELSCSN